VRASRLKALDPTAPRDNRSDTDGILAPHRLNWLFDNCVFTKPIGPQLAGDPDSDGDGIGVYWEWSGEVNHRSYSTGIGLMAICEAVELDRVVESGPLAGWTYTDVARDTMDYLSWSQMDPNTGGSRGGWSYAGSDNGVFEWEPPWGAASDNSNAGWVSLGLGYAEVPPPEGCGFIIPQFVKDELNIWIDYIQNDVDGDTDDGGSGYSHPNDWVNILKTGNLVQQMALVGDTATTPRVLDALDYMARHWGDANDDPGWRGWPGDAVNYHATFTAMKGFTALGIHEFGDPPIDWQADFETVIPQQQLGDGSWPWCMYGDPILCTTWALLTLQKVAPPPEVQIDIKPGSDPNSINPRSRGVIPVAILTTEDFDAATVDPETVVFAGASPKHYALEDVDGDGDYDLILHFKTQETDIQPGDTEACLIGQTYDGLPIVGCDSVRIVPDRDCDGCSDGAELQENPALGGERDPDNPWDFYDVPVPTAFNGGTMDDRDQAVSMVNDVLAVLGYAGTSDGGACNAGPDGVPGNADDRCYNQDNNSDGEDDGLLYDRSVGATWSDAPDGAISILEDVLLVLAQAGHSCQGAP